MLDYIKILRTTRLVEDLFTRNIQGLFVHIVVWCILIFVSGLIDVDRSFSLRVLLLWLAVSALRAVHFRLASRLHLTHPFLNYLLLLAGLWLSGGIWGATVSYVVSREHLESFQTTIIIMAAGVAGGGMAGNSPDRLGAAGFVNLIMLPPAIIMWLGGYPDRGLPILFAIYIAFLMILGRRQNQEYWQAKEYEAQLEEKTQQLERLNEIDFLTGLYNRRYFDQQLRMELKRASRSETRLTLMVLDLDHFKNINDTHGHLAGDECLRRGGDTIKSVAKRSTDVVARIGGEEFAILLPQTSEADALVLAERMRREIEELTIRFQEQRIHFTISIGVASCTPSAHGSAADLLAAADAALYLAKNGGRNRVQAVSGVRPQVSV